MQVFRERVYGTSDVCCEALQIKYAMDLQQHTSAGDGMLTVTHIIAIYTKYKKGLIPQLLTGSYH